MALWTPQKIVKYWKNTLTSTLCIGQTKKNNLAPKSHDETIHFRKNGKNYLKKCKSEQAKADPSEDGCTNGTDRLNIGDTENDSESDSKWILP